MLVQQLHSLPRQQRTVAPVKQLVCGEMWQDVAPSLGQAGAAVDLCMLDLRLHDTPGCRPGIGVLVCNLWLHYGFFGRG